MATTTPDVSTISSGANADRPETETCVHNHKGQQSERDAGASGDTDRSVRLVVWSERDRSLKRRPDLASVDQETFGASQTPCRLTVVAPNHTENLRSALAFQSPGV